MGCKFWWMTKQGENSFVNLSKGLDSRWFWGDSTVLVLGGFCQILSKCQISLKVTLSLSLYIYMGWGRFPGPMELLLQQLVRVSKTRWRWFNLNKSMLLQPLIKKLEVLVMINQWTTYCINDNNDERWMVVLLNFSWLFVKINKSCLIKC